jgi:hypothetical protein
VQYFISSVRQNFHGAKRQSFNGASASLYLPLFSGVRSETRGDNVFRLCADEAVNKFPVFEDEQGRDALNLKTRRSLRVIVNV